MLAPVYHARPVIIRIIRRLIALQLTGSKFSPNGTLLGTGGNSWTGAMTCLVDVGQSTLAILALHSSCVIANSSAEGGESSFVYFKVPSAVMYKW